MLELLKTNSDISAIDAALNIGEWIEYIAEGLVIAACIGEFLSEFTRFRTAEWRHRLSRVSLLVLIAGLAVELGALVRTNNLAGDEIALLNVEASDAHRDAANAMERANKADLARVQLQERMMWRNLSTKQALALCSAVPAPPAGASKDEATIYRVSVSSSPTDPEAWEYARQFKEAFRRCRLLPPECNNCAPPMYPFEQPIQFGLWIRTARPGGSRDDPTSSSVTMLNPSKRRALVELVRRSFENIGIRVEGVSDDAPNVSINLYVGPRVPPQDDEPTSTTPRKQ